MILGLMDLLSKVGIQVNQIYITMSHSYLQLVLISFFRKIY